MGLMNWMPVAIILYVLGGCLHFDYMREDIYDWVKDKRPSDQMLAGTAVVLAAFLWPLVAAFVMVDRVVQMLRPGDSD